MNWKYLFLFYTHALFLSFKKAFVNQKICLDSLLHSEKWYMWYETFCFLIGNHIFFPSSFSRTPLFTIFGTQIPTRGSILAAGSTPKAQSTRQMFLGPVKERRGQRWENRPQRWYLAPTVVDWASACNSKRTKTNMLKMTWWACSRFWIERKSFGPNFL